MTKQELDAVRAQLATRGAFRVEELSEWTGQNGGPVLLAMDGDGA